MSKCSLQSPLNLLEKSPLFIVNKFQLSRERDAYDQIILPGVALDTPLIILIFVKCSYKCDCCLIFKE